MPEPAEDIGFRNDNPSYLFGCYRYENAEIILQPEVAAFNGREVDISYGMRKEIREVFYPQYFPWFDVRAESFIFKNDRFELIDLVQDEYGTWTIQIWKDDYLSSKDPADLGTVYFIKSACGAS